MKKWFKVTITATLKKDIMIEAPTENDAKELIEDQYNDGQIKLEIKDIIGKPEFKVEAIKENKR